MIRLLKIFLIFVWGPIGALAADYRERLAQDEVIYFLLPDRFDNADPRNDQGGLSGGRLQTGFDPTDKGFYHGGDLRGVIKHLDYIQNLGATAIWLAPIFKNKPVQGVAGHESAGYHGYWITDFTQVDPHFGTNKDFAELVVAAHARGMKIYMDIVVNHTADVIQYRECSIRSCPYRSRADYPYTRHSGIGGEPMNDNFAGDGLQTSTNFAKLKRPDFAYTPFVPPAELHIKKPEWLNNPIYYHNRGDSTFSGENSTFGDFGGLDDLFTENPRVVAGFIEIFADWIDKYHVDGFRIDTAKHVNPEFWQAFVPAMQARAKANRIDNFHIFGEVSSRDTDPALTARHTHIDGLPAILDFPLRNVLAQLLVNDEGTDKLTQLLAGDVLYRGGAERAQQLPTFISNHDEGRFAHFIRQARAGTSDAEILARVKLAYSFLFMLRGVPTIYSGDEQGFVGHGGDQDAREDMFASKVPSYNDNILLGTLSTTAHENFHPDHPLYIALARLANLRHDHPALRRGQQRLLAGESSPGLFAMIREDEVTHERLLVAFNSSTLPIVRQVALDARDKHFSSLHGNCEAGATAPGSYRVTVPPLDFILCAIGDRRE